MFITPTKGEGKLGDMDGEDVNVVQLIIAIGSQR